MEGCTEWCGEMISIGVIGGRELTETAKERGVEEGGACAVPGECVALGARGALLHSRLPATQLSTSSSNAHGRFERCAQGSPAPQNATRAHDLRVRRVRLALPPRAR